MAKHNILAINPGSTSTKIAVYQDNDPLFVKTLRHSADDLSQFQKVTDQFEFRKSIIIKALEEEGFDISTIDAVVGRGGLLKPIVSGVYIVNDDMKRDLTNSPVGEHASNLGGLIAANIADNIKGATAYIADPVVVDELDDVARIAGHPLFSRISIFHALNQKAIARTYAASVGKEYEDLNLIVAHMGGGISVGAHRRGRVVDVNNALDGEGPFAPERSGTLPAGQLVNICFSGKYTKDQVKNMLKGGGGMMAHLGYTEVHIAMKKAAEGDYHASSILDAMAYGIGKEIGQMATVLHGRVDAILLTGGIAYSQIVTDYIKEMVAFIAPVAVYPGEDEMKSLALNGLLAMTGKVVPKIYK